MIVHPPEKPARGTLDSRMRAVSGSPFMLPFSAIVLIADCVAMMCDLRGFARIGPQLVMLVVLSIALLRSRFYFIAAGMALAGASIVISRGHTSFGLWSLLAICGAMIFGELLWLRWTEATAPGKKKMVRSAATFVGTLCLCALEGMLLKPFALLLCWGATALVAAALLFWWTRSAPVANAPSPQ